MVETWKGSKSSHIGGGRPFFDTHESPWDRVVYALAQDKPAPLQLGHQKVT